MSRIAHFLGSAMSIAALAALTLPVSAQQVTLDLAGQPSGAFTSLTDNGYTLTYVGFGDQPAIQVVNGVNALVDSNPFDASGAGVYITKNGGGNFNLTALDIANQDNTVPIGVTPGSGFRIEVSGVPSGDDAYGPGSSAFTTVTPTDLTNQSSVYLNIVSASGFADFAVTNIVVSPVVPEPSVLLEFGSFVMVGGIGLLRRKRAAKSA